MPKLKIAIIGSGPAGLSAACRAASHGVSHILIERADHLCDTIFRYQKRKLVMCTPAALPLRSDAPFGEGQRETILAGFGEAVQRASVNTRLNAEVAAISGQLGAFQIVLKSGERLEAEHVVLAIGVQGNLRRLTVPGADLPFVQYQLDDPDEYQGESIAVIGGGDAGIENALGLVANNSVTLVNNQMEFAYAKPANVAKVNDEVKAGRLDTILGATPERIEPGKLVLKTPQGEAIIKVDRIIARIGALPPRTFLESCGIKFASDAPSAVPIVSPSYESSVPGIFIVGALAGYPLIKNCLNQGYEVVERILGNPIPPADEPLIQSRIDKARLSWSVTNLIDALRAKVPLFSALSPLQIRETMAVSNLLNVPAGEVVFRRNDYTNSLIVVVDGRLGVQVDQQVQEQPIGIDAGSFVGEMGLISGRRRTATVVATSPSVLVEVPRNTMIRLVRSFPDVKRHIDEAAMVRQFQTFVAPGATREELAPTIASSKLVSFKTGDVLIKEGASEDSVFLIRSGSVAISKKLGDREVTLSYVQAGHYVGEMAMLNRSPRSATVKASVATEAIEIEADALRALLAERPEIQADFARKMATRGVESARVEDGRDDSALVEALLGQGFGEATDVLVIDESKCVQCDNCENACAETHGGVSRLSRAAGPTFANIHVPTACRHCEHPHCMKDCPPDALTRTKAGEVVINHAACIGCGNCQRNCPYGVIKMAHPTAQKPNFLFWLLFGAGPGPGRGMEIEGPSKAVKCDLCSGLSGGPSCVRSCPTGAASRVHPQQLFDLIREGGR